MVHLPRLTPATALVLASLLGAGCGAPSPTPVTVAGTTPSRVDLQGAAGLRQPTLTFDVALQGDPAWLKEQNGGVLYAVALDTGTVYDSYNTLHYTNPPAVHFTVFGAPTGAPAGHYVGDMQLLVCLDANCRRQLAGSPVTLPYVIDLAPPVAFSRPAVTPETPFGTTPPPQVVTVLVARGGAGVVAGVTSTPEVDVSLQAPATVTVTPKAAAPGTYHAAIEVFATFTDPVYNNVSQPSAVLPVTYTVLAGP